MNKQQPDFREEAARYNSALPRRIRKYLVDRGIPEQQIDLHLLGWTGSRITIPIPDATGRISQFRLAKDPLDRSDSPKMLSTPHSHATLYGWDTLEREPERVVICEGEFDRLVLEARGFDGVTSTGGALTFRPEWVPFFEMIPEVFICLDRDQAGELGSDRIANLLPRAKVVALPEVVGDGGDISDFFVRLGKNAEDFEELLRSATPAAKAPQTPRDYRLSSIEARLDDRVLRAKRALRIEDVTGRYVELQVSGSTLVGHCPFHSDERPSFVVFPGTQSFYCFGCGEGGDVLNFLRRQLRLSFPQALDAAERLIPSNEREAA